MELFLINYHYYNMPYSHTQTDIEAKTLLLDVVKKYNKSDL